MNNFIENMKLSIAEIAFKNGAYAVIADYDSINDWWNFIIIKNDNAIILEYNPKDFLEIYTTEFNTIKNYLNKGDDSLTNEICKQKPNIEITTTPDASKEDQIFFNFIYGYLKFMI